MCVTISRVTKPHYRSDVARGVISQALKSLILCRGVRKVRALLPFCAKRFLYMTKRHFLSLFFLHIINISYISARNMLIY